MFATVQFGLMKDCNRNRFSKAFGYKDDGAAHGVKLVIRSIGHTLGFTINHFGVARTFF